MIKGIKMRKMKGIRKMIKTIKRETLKRMIRRARMMIVQYHNSEDKEEEKSKSPPKLDKRQKGKTLERLDKLKNDQKSFEQSEKSEAKLESSLKI